MLYMGIEYKYIMQLPSLMSDMTLCAVSYDHLQYIPSSKP